jgi:hypothetical protein
MTSRAIPTPEPSANRPLLNGDDQQHDTANHGESEFDLSKYAYKAPTVGAIRREQLTIPEGRPKDVFFRIDPREEMQQPVAIFEYKPEGRLSSDTHILTPDIAEQLGRRSRYAIVRVCICRPNIARLWAVKVPDTDRGSTNSFTQTAWEAIPFLEKAWDRLDLNESGTGYDVVLPESAWPEPEWRTDSLGSLIHKAYRGRFIDNMDHPIIKALRGQD